MELISGSLSQNILVLEVDPVSSVTVDTCGIVLLNVSLAVGLLACLVADCWTGSTDSPPEMSRCSVGTDTLVVGSGGFSWTQVS